MKKIICVLISTILLAGCISVCAYSFTDIGSYDPAVDLLSETGIVKGYSDSEFGPATRVSRWQMALFLTRAVTGKASDLIWGAEVSGLKFTDVEPHHYMSAIAYASVNGIIAGRSETVFDPDAGITLQEGVTMAVRTLGYPAAEYDNNWPKGYIKKGTELGLYEGLEGVSDTSTLNRQQTAKLVYNMLFAERYSDESLASANFGCISSAMVLTSTPDSRLTEDHPYAQSGEYIFTLPDDSGAHGFSYAADSARVDINDIENKLGNVFYIVGRISPEGNIDVYSIREY